MRHLTHLVLTVAVLIGVAAPAAAHPAVTASDVAVWHVRHDHHQWHHGRGTPGHTWTEYRHQARRLNRYLRAAHLAALRRYALVVRWSGVADCESSGNWAINTGNGYYGGLQFSLGTWQAYGGTGRPDLQPAWVQATVADRVRVQSGLHHWPVCGARYG